jgi:phospholipid N-methyltransferase
MLQPDGLHATPDRRPADPRILFFRSFLARPREVGSIIPSSRFLERRITRCADVQTSRVVVELGPGTGGTTQAVLRAMPADAQLLSIEINPGLASLVRSRIHDRRLTVHQGSAADLPAALARHGLGAPDVVLSGIPFSTLPRGLALRILWAVHNSLALGGRFVAYQVRDRVAVLGRQVFGHPSVAMELFNVPPMRIYRFEKTLDA